MNQNTTMEVDLTEELIGGTPQRKLRRIGIMVDSESLGLDPDTIVREIAFVAFDLDDPETIIGEAYESLPLQPQEELGRKISVMTVAWMMSQPAHIRDSIERNMNGDVEEFLSVCRSLVRKFSRMTHESDYYETWFARPQHDVPLIQSVFKTAGLTIPWQYDTVNDLRTLMNEVNMSPRDEDVKALGAGLKLHTARGDCLYQIRCYHEAIRRLRAR